MDTLLQIKQLEKYIEMNNQSIDSVFMLSINKLLHREQRRLSELKSSLMKEINEFETKYQISSKTFYAKFNQGELGDNMDYIDWASTIDMIGNLENQILTLQ